MVDGLQPLLENNRLWAKQMLANDTAFFSTLAKQQAPEYLWIGCSDSRVPANTIIGLMPGEVFVHRNIANIVNREDVNCMSVLQFAVSILKVKHIIVCGHYGCGGVMAAVNGLPDPLLKHWLKPISQLYQTEATQCHHLDEEGRLNHLCERNVKQQIENIAATEVVQTAWKNQQPLALYGVIYSIQDGILRDLDVTQSGALVKRPMD